MSATLVTPKTTSGGEIITHLINATDGEGLHFDGAAGNIDIATPPDLGTKFSIEFIAQADSWGSANNYLVDFGTSGRFAIASFSSISYNLGVFDGTTWFSFGAKVLDDLKVHHLTVTIDGTSAILYDNANQVGTATITTPTLDACTDAAIASKFDGSSSWFDGTMYRARLWNKTLTAAEVTASYENATVPFADQYGSQTEKVTNGSFASDTAWTKNSAWSIGSGVATADGLAANRIYQDIGIVSGKSYRYSFDWNRTSGTSVTFQYHNGTDYVTIIDVTDTGSGTATGTFTVEPDTDYSVIYFAATGNWAGTIDNVTVRAVGVVSDYDLAFANPTQSDQVQDRSTNLADGTASAGVEQVTKIEAVNTNKLNVGGTTPLVGIGLAAGVTPSQTLTLDGPDGSAYIGLKNAVATTGARLGFNSTVLRLQNFEAAGIDFYVNNTKKALSINADGALTLDGVTANGWMQFKDAGVLSGYIGGGIGLAASPNNLNTDLAIRAKTKLAFCTNNSNAAKMVIDSAGTVQYAPLGNAKSIEIDAPTATSVNVIDVNDCNSLTTGGIAYLRSNSSNTSARNLLEVVNANSAAVNTVCIKATGGGIVETGGVLKSNLLTNSAFSVWSNSTLVEVTSGAAPVTSGANAALVNNLLTNGGFDSATTGWTPVTAELSSVAGGQTGNQLRVESDDGTEGSAIQDVTTVIGKLYYLTYYLAKGTSGTVAVNAGPNSSPQDYVSNADSDFTGAALTNFTWVFEATSTATRITLKTRDSAGEDYSDFDTVGLYEVTPGCVAADEKAMDGWSKASDGYGAFGPDILRQHDDSGTLTHDGAFYSTKMTTGTAGHTALTWPSYDVYREPTLVARFQGRTVTFGMWVKMADSASNFVLNISDGVGSSASTAHAANTDWEWMEATHTFSGSATEVKIHCYSNTAGSVHYISQPMLVFGSAIGSGNYSRPMGEIVWFEKAVTLTGHNNDSITTATDGTTNLEAASNGVIPKGAEAVHYLLAAQSVTTDIAFSLGTTNNKNSGLYSSGVSNKWIRASDWTRCDSNGDLFTAVENTFASHYLEIGGVQLR